MITTVTLNVSVDKAYEVKDKIQAGTVARVNHVRNSAGGKGLNVARTIAYCGEVVQATGFAGGFNGEYVKSMLEDDGISSNFVNIKNETRSCINILTPDGLSTEFLEPGAPVSQDEYQEFIEKFWGIIGESDVITLSGSIPQGLPVNIYERLITMAKSQGKKVILDTSGTALEKGITAGPSFIKPNQEEMEAILGIEINDKKELIQAANDILQYGVKQVAISMGSEGALLVTKDKVLHGKPPKIDAVNPVGCGDSMVGAFAVSIARNESLEESLRYAIAVSAANAMNPETGRFDQKDMEMLMSRVEITEVEL